MRIERGEFSADPLATIELIDASSITTVEGQHSKCPLHLSKRPSLQSAPCSTPSGQSFVWQEFGYKKSRDLIRTDLFSATHRLRGYNPHEEFISISAEVASIVSEYVAKTGGRITDLYRWCRQLTMEVLMRTLLLGCISPGVSRPELEDATIRVISLLSKVILRVPWRTSTLLDELETKSHTELQTYVRLFQRTSVVRARNDRPSHDDHLSRHYEQMASVMYWLVAYSAERPFMQIPHIGYKEYVNEVIRALPLADLDDHATPEKRRLH